MILELSLAAGLAALFQVPHQHEHPPRSAEGYARILEDPSRDAWQKPHEVVQALEIRPEEVVADIGAGSGYFSRRLARHAAKVYAVDIDPKLLDRAAKDAPKTLETVLAEPDDPKLRAASVDTIFFCNVLHHIDNRAAYYEKLDAALKPGGRIVMLDFQKRDLPVGPPVSMKLSEQEVIDEMAAAGFVKARSFDFLAYQYFLVFERRAASN
ncbi:MAG: methyltransferase domain-containing protein [Bryobacteraceae bacterium]|nr:methyltransferase domain-containing protein [Bryobacteraceae bacterium]